MQLKNAEEGGVSSEHLVGKNIHRYLLVCPEPVWSAKSLNWPILTRAHAPRQVAGGTSARRRRSSPASGRRCGSFPPLRRSSLVVRRFGRGGAWEAEVLASRSFPPPRALLAWRFVRRVAWEADGTCLSQIAEGEAAEAARKQAALLVRKERLTLVGQVLSSA